MRELLEERFSNVLPTTEHSALMFRRASRPGCSCVLYGIILGVEAWTLPLWVFSGIPGVDSPVAHSCENSGLWPLLNVPREVKISSCRESLVCIWPHELVLIQGLR